MDNNERIAKNTVYLTIRMVFMMAVSLYTSRVFLRVLGVEDYGISNVVSGFVSMFAFIRASLSNATQRFYNYEIGANGVETIERVYSVSLVIQIVIGIIVLVLLESVGLWYLYKKMVIPDDRFSIAFWLYQMSVVSCFITIMQIPYFAAIMAFEKMGFYAFVSIFDVVLKLIFAFLIPFVPLDKLLSFGLFTLFVSIVTFVINCVYCKIKFPFLHFSRIKDMALLKDMMSFAGWNAFGSFSITFREQGLNMILNLFYGPAMNAARGVAYQVTNAINGLVQTLSVAAKPQIMQSYGEGNQNRSIRLMFGISKLSYILMFMLIVPVSLEVHYILSLWLGETVPAFTGSFIRIVALTTLVNTLTAQLSTMVHATGKMKMYQIITSLFCLIVLPLAYYYLKIYTNPTGVFIIMLIVISINYIISALILRTLTAFSISEYAKSIVLPMLFASLLSVIIPIFVHNAMTPGFYRLLVVTLVSILSIVLFFYMFGLNVEERRLVARFLKK